MLPTFYTDNFCCIGLWYTRCACLLKQLKQMILWSELLTQVYQIINKTDAIICLDLCQNSMPFTLKLMFFVYTMRKRTCILNSKKVSTIGFWAGLKTLQFYDYH